MSSVYIDIIIIILLIFGFLLGFKRGFTRQLVAVLGSIAILALSYFLKHPVAVFLSTHFPVIKYEELSILNYHIYDAIAFMICFMILSIILRILIKVTNIFERILKATIILGIPSKILGGLLGIIEKYIMIFLVLNCLSMPVFKLNINSSLSNYIMYKTPILSSMIKEKDTTYENLNELKKQYEDKLLNYE